MNNEQKLELLKQWLQENGFNYKENYESHSCGVTIPLRVIQPRIAVYVGHDNAFYHKVKKAYNPFFIREEETMDFILEKMQNCINNFGSAKRRREEKKAQAVKPKRKRIRITKYEKV